LYFIVHILRRLYFSQGEKENVVSLRQASSTHDTEERKSSEKESEHKDCAANVGRGLDPNKTTAKNGVYLHLLPLRSPE
jgi:hypothetical protein